MPSHNHKLTAALGVVAAILIAAVGMAPRAQGASQAATAPTFARDIAPILFANCVECHRSGEIAPMSLITYAEVRPWAKAILREVAERSKRVAKKVDWDSNQRSRMRSVISFGLILPIGFAIGAWLVWG